MWIHSLQHRTHDPKNKNKKTNQMTIELEQSNLSIFRTVKVYSTTQKWFGVKKIQKTLNLTHQFIKQ